MLFKTTPVPAPAAAAATTSTIAFSSKNTCLLFSIMNPTEQQTSIITHGSRCVYIELMYMYIS